MQKGKTNTSWRSKLEKAMEPKRVEVPVKWAGRIGPGLMLVPTPKLVDKTIRKIPRGKLATVNSIRDYLAEAYRADITCPLTTGIFINIAAHAAEEDFAGGKRKITPWWRVLKEGGELNPKYPGAPRQQAARLQQEGFEVIRGKNSNRYFVKDYQKKLSRWGKPPLLTF